MKWNAQNFAYCKAGFKHQIVQEKPELIVRVSCPIEGCTWNKIFSDPVKAVKGEYHHMDYHYERGEPWIL